MKPKPIPDRWLEYSACGSVIEGTRLICFKVPLRREVQQKEPSITKLWDVPAVLAEIPRLSAVIDLTNTARYYNPNEFLAAKVLHKKILMPGRIIPPENKVKEFMDAVDEFLGRDCDSLVGVHCTHGLNRTGYMVCRYMRDRLGMAAADAIKKFETARGYLIERDVYINGILNKPPVTGPEGKEPDRTENVNNHKNVDDVPEVDNQPNGYNYKRDRRFNNMPPRHHPYATNRGRRGHYHAPYTNQPFLANRGHTQTPYNQGPSRSYNNSDHFNSQYSNHHENNHRFNNRYTPNNKRGNNYRGHDRRNYNNRYGGGSNSTDRNNYYQSGRSTDNWRRGHTYTNNQSTYTWRSSDSDKFKNEPKADD